MLWLSRNWRPTFKCRDRRVQEMDWEDPAPVETDSSKDGNDKKWCKTRKVVDEELPPESCNTYPEGLSYFTNWAQMWTLGLANKDEEQL